MIRNDGVRLIRMTDLKIVGQLKEVVVKTNNSNKVSLIIFTNKKIIRFEFSDSGFYVKKKTFFDCFLKCNF